ncbi:steroid 17-alpha-hydroxylase/17,20 lyase [Eleutherodactylus coqui]|uniref:steroid 17-alpha-hydroxylase/17,20 lyase n=1 Tax=Eleutherodactylus coqui TaxID=57060 RepID=UPI0034635200
MIVWLGGALLVAFGLILISIRRQGLRSHGTVKYPKSLPSLPVIGSLLHLGNHLPPHILFCNLQKKYGKLYSFKMGSHYVVVVNNYEDAREVLLKKGKTFAGRPRTVTTDILTRDAKDIAFANYSPTWKFHRKLVHSSLSMFGEGTVAIEQIISREAASLCQTLSTFQTIPFNMEPEITRAITNVVCALCFNTRYRRGDAEFQSMLSYCKGIVDTVAKDSLVDIFPWLQIFPNKDLDILRNSVRCRDQLLEKKLKEHEAAFCSETVNDLLDALLKAKLSMENNNSNLSHDVGLTEDHILMTVGDIFGAGVETTSTVLKWAIAYMMHYPEVQKKIQEELDVNVGFGRYPLLSDRKILHYLEATIAEVLRIRPVSPLLIPHVAMKDTSIGEYTIPKEARVVINLWSMHHDEKEWVHPENFNPDRFLDENGHRVCSPSQSYLPFGAGIRVCLGEALAKMEVFLFLSWVLQRFTLEVPEGEPLPSLEGKFGVVLQVKPFKVTAKLRDVWKNIDIAT